MIRVLLGLGTNSAFDGKEPLELLARAVTAIRGYVADTKVSSVYETEPMYVTDQNKFLNLAVCGAVADSLQPAELLELIHRTESALGRKRAQELRFGPRSIDIDIEDFGGRTLNEPLLQIPHPRIAERQFVLVPSLEILDRFADSLLREKLAGYLAALPDQGVRKCPEEVQARFAGLVHDLR